MRAKPDPIGVVANLLNDEVLVKRVAFYVLLDDPPAVETACDAVSTGTVVDGLGVGDVLNVSNETVIGLCGLLRGIPTRRRNADSEVTLLHRPRDLVNDRVAQVKRVPRLVVALAPPLRLPLPLWMGDELMRLAGLLPHVMVSLLGFLQALNDPFVILVVAIGWHYAAQPENVIFFIGALASS